jgi:hypothetical protein
MVPAFAAIILFMLMVVLHALGARDLYNAIIRGWGVEPFSFPFLDTDTVLSAIRCLRKGVDVFVVNPCDYLGRVYDYSPLWLTLAAFPITLGWLLPIGFGLDVAFLGALFLLPAGRTRRDVALIAFGVVSSATVYAVERGNNDLVIFILAAGAATLSCRSPMLRVIGYALALLAGLLKYYPMTLMAMATRERPSRFFAIAAGSFAVVALFIAIAGHDLARALQLIPTGPYFSDMFGSVTVAGGLTQLIGWPQFVGAVLHGAMMIAAILIGVRLGRSDGMIADVARLSERERAFLLAGVMLTCGCFFTAQNIGYRVVHLVLLLPAIVALRRTADSRVYGWGVMATLGLLWSQAWRHALLVALTPFGERAQNTGVLFGWIMREALWWWLIALLVGLFTALLLKSEMGIFAQRLVMGSPDRVPRPDDR